MTASKISVSLLFLNWIKNEMIFNCISELMLPTLIQRYDKNHFVFAPVLKWELSEILQTDPINTIYQFIKPSLDNKMSTFLRNMEPLKFSPTASVWYQTCRCVVADP